MLDPRYSNQKVVLYRFNLAYKGELTDRKLDCKVLDAAEWRCRIFGRESGPFTASASEIRTENALKAYHLLDHPDHHLPKTQKLVGNNNNTEHELRETRSSHPS